MSVSEADAPAGSYFDGRTARRRAVTLSISTDDHLEGRDPFLGEAVFRWPLEAIREVDEGTSAFHRVGGEDGPGGAERLIVHSEAFLATLYARAGSLKEQRRVSASSARKIAFWSVAATVGVVASVWFGVPVLAKAIAPLVPAKTEIAMADGLEDALASILDIDSLAERACRNAETERILADLSKRIVGEETFVVTPTVRIVDHPLENALAFLGGRVIVFRGLLEAVQSPDELTGVIAHEFGHVVARDSLVRIIEAAGLGFVFGYVLGDFTGGTAVVLAAQAIVSSAYSREAEAAADAFAARRMMALGGDPLASIRLIERIAGGEDVGNATPLDSHPLTEERNAAVRALAARYTARAPLISAADLNVLQAACPRRLR